MILSRLNELDYEESTGLSSFVIVPKPEERERKRKLSALAFLSEYLAPEWTKKLKDAEGRVKQAPLPS